MDLFNQSETETHLDEKELSSAVGFRNDHVSRFQLQEQERVQKILATSGQKCLRLSKQSTRTTLLGRMCLDYLVSKGEWYLNRCALTWKAKATKSRRLYFQLVPRVHRTDGIESGLLPQMPTPKKSDADGGVTQTVTQKNGRFVRTSQTTGTEFGANLRDAVGMMLPTPKKQNANSPGVHGQGGMDLQTKIQGLLPTPTHSDCGAKQTANSNQPGLLAITGQTGHLSHHFTLDMMGFPKNWCDISEPVLQRLEKRLKTLKRISGKKPTGSGSKQ